MAVFLDRDGVLNRGAAVEGRPVPPRGVGEFELLEGVAHSCAELKAAGLSLIVVTNQPDIARGTTPIEEVEELNSLLAAQLPLDDILMCPHDDADDCVCRKPRPGLLIEGARRHHIDLPASFMVGDRWRDIEAGRDVGCRTIFVDHGYAERQPANPDLTVDSLSEAVPWILERAVADEGTRP
jgi:D-glycero-D-manno-heptose 1,7-bisphosphate phosphatase